MYILVVDGVDGECEIPGGCCTEPAFVAGIRAAVEKFEAGQVAEALA